jgi:hypothetical protein
MPSDLEGVYMKPVLCVYGLFYLFIIFELFVWCSNQPPLPKMTQVDTTACLERYQDVPDYCR